MRYLNFIYGAMATFVLLLLPANVTACITCGTVITCTLYILEAIKDSKTNINYDNDNQNINN